MNRLTLSLVLLGFLAAAAPSQAAFYGDFTSGSAITFRNVQDVNGLFGAPTVAGNLLSFAPAGFEADCASEVTCPPTPASTDDLLTMDVEVASGFYMPRIVLWEEGSTLIDAGALPTGFAATSVVADIFVDITEIDGVGVSGVNANALMGFTQNGNFDTDIHGDGNHAWNGFLSLNLDNIIAAAGLSGQATGATLSISNTLTAFAENGATASIQKNDLDGLVVNFLVPEPGTGLLLGLGLAGLAGSRRQRKASLETAV